MATNPDEVLAVGGQQADPDRVLAVDGKAPPTPQVQPSHDEPLAINGVSTKPKEGFWKEFGGEHGTGGVWGIVTAPFTSSIPAELVKARGREISEDPSSLLKDPFGLGVYGMAYKKIKDFMDSGGDKSLSQRMRESFSGMVQFAREHKGAFAGSLVKGLFADPELFFIPGATETKVAGAVTESLQTAGKGLRTAQAVGAVAGKATAVGTGAAIGGGAEAARELGEDEPFDPGALIVSTGIGAAAGFAQPFRAREGKLSTADAERIIAPAAAKGPLPTKAEVHPVADGYLVRLPGESEGKVFPTKAEADAAAQEVVELGSGYRAMETVPRGTDSPAGERARLLEDNPFTAEKMADMIKKPTRPMKETAADLASWLGRTAAVAAIPAAVGAYLDRDDPGTGAAFGAATVAVPRVLGKISPKGTRISIEDAINTRNGELAVWARKTLSFKAAIDALVQETERRAAISRFLEGHPGVVLNAREQQVAAQVRAFFDQMGQAAVKAGVLKELLTNYVSHIVEEDPESSKTRGLIGDLVDAIMGTRAEGTGAPTSGRQFAEHRKYATFDELQAALNKSNLRVKTTDIGEIMAIYSKAMFRSITDRRLLDALKASPVPEMPPLVRPERTGPPVPAGEGFRIPPGTPPGAAAAKFAAKPRFLIQPEADADSTYVRMPSRQLAGFVVHRDIAPQLNFVFNARDPLDITRALMMLNQASKRAIVSFSLFHAKSLTDAYVGAAKASRLPNIRGDVAKALQMLMRGGSNDGIDLLLRHGLNLQFPEDIATDKLHGALDRIAHIFDQHLPVSPVTAAAKGFARFNDTLDRFTFSTLQAGFKIITALDAHERLIKKGLDPKRAATLAASYANDIYGGLDWFRVANDVGSRLGRDAAYAFFSPTGRRWLQLAMFAPDWTFSTFRAAYKALPGSVDDPALAALHRRYLAKSAIYYLTIANGINLVTAGHSIFSNENPTRIQLGDGRTMQFSKHFNEPAEWLRDPIQTAANKLAFLPRQTVETLTGKEYISAHDAAPDIENRATQIASQFLPITAQQGLAGGGAQSVLGLFGMPIYGKTPGEKAEAQLKKKIAAQEKRKRAAAHYQRQHQ